MTREEIPYKHGFPSQCSMCKIEIGADESRVAVYENDGRKREYAGILCPTCAKIGKEEEKKPVVLKEDIWAKDMIVDMKMILHVYDLGVKYAEQNKIKVQPDDMMKAAISVFIAADKRGY